MRKIVKFIVAIISIPLVIVLLVWIFFSKTPFFEGREIYDDVDDVRIK